MAEVLRREVLHQFKKLHRTRLNKFQGDDHALKVVRDKINEEYRRNINITNEAAVKELNKFAQEVEHELRTNVIQAIEKKPGVFTLRITPDVLLDNATCDQVNSENKTSVCEKNSKK